MGLVQASELERFVMLGLLAMHGLMAALLGLS
jgi:hypothetical protein